MNTTTNTREKKQHLGEVALRRGVGGQGRGAQVLLSALCASCHVCLCVLCSFDVGLWQVNTQNWNSCSGGSPPCDPGTNLGCAVDVWRWGGGTFKLWSTCGGCNACGDANDVAAAAALEAWDGSYPKNYNASRPFPAHAMKVADRRIMPQ